MSEAECFARYLIGKVPSDHIADLYNQAIAKRKRSLSPTDIKILTFARNHPWSIQFLDAGAAIGRSDCELRHRLYIMFALLETVPEFSEYFLPRERSGGYVVIMGWAALKAGFKALVGWVLVAMA